MRILLALTDIYSTTGGGQSFYKSIVKRHPENEYWYFETRSTDLTALPSNVRLLPLGDRYRRNRAGVAFDRAQFVVEGHSFIGAEADVLYMLDMAASCVGRDFDVLEIPDFLAFGALLPSAMRWYGIKFDKVVVSMHGTISDALTDNWLAADTMDLALSRKLETMLYQTADIRYGISLPYIEKWTRDCGRPAHLIDLLRLIDMDGFADLRARHANPTTRSRPDLVFVGRQERWKGPDLFIELVSSIPEAVYSDAIMVGPSVQLRGIDSWSILSKMARNRCLEIKNIHLSQAELWNSYAKNTWATIFPSRKDTLNLAALESLLCGSPATISVHAGVCEFLNNVFPSLPYLEHDPHDLASARSSILELVCNYSEHRAALLQYLATAEPVPRGETLTAIYNSDHSPDSNQRNMLDSLVARVAEHTDHLLGERTRSESHAQLVSYLDGIFSGDQSSIRNILVGAFESSHDLVTIQRDSKVTQKNAAGLPDYEFSLLTSRLHSYCSSTDRVPVYQLLAEVERRRGNALLFATYQIRAMRLSGKSNPSILQDVCKVLRESGFPNEANAARMLYGRPCDLGGAQIHLNEMAKKFSKLPAESFSSRLDRRNAETPKVSIIVSLYNAADKIPTFLRGIHQLTDNTLRNAELIFIDSNSKDQSSEVVSQVLDQHAKHGRAVSTLCVRTPERETIQRAWNRGIALARGEYLAFLGIDEMNRPDAFDILADYLDHHPEVDWVQGSAVVTEVDAAGAYVRDVMGYNRVFDTQSMQLLDTCYIGYVGALYRRSLHDRVGYYDDSFRAAGDTEFKNRALRSMKVVTLPQCLGTFRNYPDERTTQSPVAELEDLRAWYLHRSLAGIEYSFGSSDDHKALELFFRCLGYRKSYMDLNCTDLELAVCISEYLSQQAGSAWAEIQTIAPLVRAARDYYRSLDQVTEFTSAARSLNGVLATAQKIEVVALGLNRLMQDFQFGGRSMQLDFINDNRSHQHHWIWPSRLPARQEHVGEAGETIRLNESTIGNGALLPVAARKEIRKLGQLVKKVMRYGSLAGREQKFILEGDSARDAGDWKGAAAAYRRVLAVDPRLAHVWVQLGHSLKEQGDRENGEMAYRQAIKIDDENPDTHLQLGHVLKLQNRLAEASHSYFWALKLDPNLHDARRELVALGYVKSEISSALANGVLPVKQRGVR